MDPPEILVQPVSRTELEDTNVDFSVITTGLLLTYQWRRNGMDIADVVGDISGATTATLTITTIIDPDDKGDYTVVVTNAAGTVTSDVASLIVGELCF